MNLTHALYLTDLVGNLDVVIGFVSFVGIIAMIIACVGKIFCLDPDVDRSGNARKLWRSITSKWWVVLILMLMNCIFPSKKTMYLMLGSSYLQDSNLPKKVSSALKLKLDEYIAELTTKKDKE